MGRKTKQVVDYFPHMAGSSRTKRILQKYWGNDGYAFWFKLLEMLCDEDGHYLELYGPAEWEDFLIYTGVDGDTAYSIIEKLCELGKIDAELWVCCRVVWCPSFVENLEPLYTRRKNLCPGKPSIDAFPLQKCKLGRISAAEIHDAETPQNNDLTDITAAETPTSTDKCSKNVSSDAFMMQESELNPISTDINQQRRVEESRVKESREERKGSLSISEIDIPPEDKAPPDDTATRLLKLYVELHGKHNERAATDGIVDWLDLVGPEIVEYAIRFAKENRTGGGKPWRYVEQILRGWDNAGLKSVPDIERFTKPEQGGHGNAANGRDNPGIAGETWDLQTTRI